MDIPFEMAGIPDWNAANPCACPEPECEFATLTMQAREVETCIGGFGPNTMDYAPDGSVSYPDAFDERSNGVLWPLYRTRTESTRVVISATAHDHAERYSGGVLVDSFDAVAATEYDVTDSVDEGFQRLPEYWPASNIPLGNCPPEDTILPVAAPAGLSSSAGTPADGLVPVSLSWTENRDDDTRPESDPGDGSPLPKMGFYQVKVDGVDYLSDEPEWLVSLSEGDATCHEFRVRHLLTGAPFERAGQWSAAVAFSLTGNPCCEPEPQGCSDPTHGNNQRSATPAAILSMDSWTAGAESGHNPQCGGATPADPTGLGIYLVSASAGPITGVSSSRTATTIADVTTRAQSTPNTSSADPGVSGWQISISESSGTGSTTVATTLSDDRNGGQTTVDSLFDAALATLAGWDDSYGWGISLGGTSWPEWSAGADALAVGSFPETDGSGSILTGLYARVRELRYQWVIPADYVGDKHTTAWDVARFPLVWLEWRTARYAWAVAKHAFLHKPEPGDDDYPQPGDFDDPDDYAAAVAAIDAITDPGDEPEEPADDLPEIVDSPDPWEWTSEQAERDPEAIDACDPTYSARTLIEPVEPASEDYPDSETFDTAHAAWVTAHTQWALDVAARAEASKRESDWYRFVPDRISSYRDKPAPVPDLPTTPPPTDAEVAAHTLAVAVYDNRLAKYNAARREVFLICNVRHTCGDSPYGPLATYDLWFHTTSLPPLHPAEEDPARWVLWHA